MSGPRPLILALVSLLLAAAPVSAQGLRGGGVGVRVGGRSWGGGVGVQAGGRGQAHVGGGQVGVRVGGRSAGGQVGVRVGNSPNNWGRVQLGARQDWGYRHSSWSRRPYGYTGPTYTTGTSPRRATTVYVAPQPCPPVRGPRRVRVLRYSDGTAQAVIVASGAEAYDTPQPYVVIARPIYPDDPQAAPRLTEARARVLAEDERRAAAERTPAPAAPAAPAAPKQPSLAERLEAALDKGDLSEACKVAAWAQDDPRREQALQAALFRRFPSPELLSKNAAKLQETQALRDVPGRATLARLLGPVAPKAPQEK
ncbi:MAG: hypothetical protein AB7N76_31290 [Planctomycetota bacterium]